MAGDEEAHLSLGEGGGVAMPLDEDGERFRYVEMVDCNIGYNEDAIGKEWLREKKFMTVVEKMKMPVHRELCTRFIKGIREGEDAVIINGDTKLNISADWVAAAFGLPKSGEIIEDSKAEEVITTYMKLGEGYKLDPKHGYRMNEFMTIHVPRVRFLTMFLGMRKRLEACSKTMVRIYDHLEKGKPVNLSEYLRKKILAEARKCNKMEAGGNTYETLCFPYVQALAMCIGANETPLRMIIVQRRGSADEEENDEERIPEVETHTVEYSLKRASFPEEMLHTPKRQRDGEAHENDGKPPEVITEEMTETPSPKKIDDWMTVERVNPTQACREGLDRIERAVKENTRLIMKMSRRQERLADETRKTDRVGHGMLRELLNVLTGGGAAPRYELEYDDPGVKTEAETDTEMNVSEMKPDTDRNPDTDTKVVQKMRRENMELRAGNEQEKVNVERLKRGIEKLETDLERAKRRGEEYESDLVKTNRKVQELEAENVKLKLHNIRLQQAMADHNVQLE